MRTPFLSGSPDDDDAEQATTTPSAPTEDELILAAAVSYVTATESADDEEEEGGGLLTAGESRVSPSAPPEASILIAGIVDEINNDQNNHGNAVTPAPARAPPHLTEDDILAQEIAAEARQRGEAVIRHHVAHYLDANPNASFVTWIATLHPENAHVTIDPRFFIPGNPWSTVFEQARGAMNDGFVVVEEFDVENENTHCNTTTTDHHQPATTSSLRVGRHYNFGGLIPLIVGFSTIFAAMLVALSLQMVASFVFVMAVANYQVYNVLPRLNVCSALLYPLPCGFLALFWSLDLCLLLLDTVLVEVLAALAYVVCAPLALSHTVGVVYHQSTRKFAHYIRWASRLPLNRANCRLPRGPNAILQYVDIWRAGQGGQEEENDGHYVPLGGPEEDASRDSP